MIIWFTGQPGSGKSTLALATLSRLLPKPREIIDGDIIRDLLLPLGFSKTERRKNVDRAQAIAVFLSVLEYNVTVSVVAPYRDQRERFKKFIGKDILEVYLYNDSTYKCEYVVKDYQPPLENFLEIDTGILTVDSCIDIIKREIRSIHR